jgi:hypothetical protein
MQSKHEPSDHEEPTVDPSQLPEEPNPDDDEFHITIKKLDTVVRPRGVLADG